MEWERTYTSDYATFEVDVIGPSLIKCLARNRRQTIKYDNAVGFPYSRLEVRSV
jgi:hypothetical protein